MCCVASVCRGAHVERIYRSAMATMLERLQDAANGHDPQRLASLFAEDYRSIQPLQPTRGFGGSEQVRENWLSVLEGVPDFTSDLAAVSLGGEVQWGECQLHGHHVDG